MNINDLKLIDEQLPAVDLDVLKEQQGSYTLPQPGVYTFQLPPSMDEVFDVVQTDAGQRLQLTLEGKNYLRIGELDKVFCRISNRDYPWGGETVNDMAYLAKALGYHGKLTTNREYLEALKSEGGSKFEAELSWTAKNKATGKEWAAPRGFKRVKGQKAGTEVYQVPRDAKGAFLQEFMDGEDSIRCFPQLRSFRPAK
jgi:hypothetical protein